MTLQQRVDEAVEVIRGRVSLQPEVALILGSGLGELAEKIEQPAVLPYGEIPHFKCSGAPGHKGRLVFGQLAGRRVAAMQGRLHGFEGHAAADIVFPLRTLQALGAQTLIVTNASGGINTGFQVGDFMLINDHINFSGTNPLTIDADSGWPPFFDMTYAYTPALRELALQAASELGIQLQQGVYLSLRGPSFETPAEIRAFRLWGADAVGMSTVFEVITAASLGMQVLGISLITNMAAGVLDQPLTGEEVLEAGHGAAAELERLIREVLSRLQPA
ncbi:MAG: purine-nucleoside phosphorylase [Coriobacteriales bacterium]|jgi:purine-nucleoside phosphorylase|nr:purine-nucleoside phosphorylase [Coriobacteriales bacterium]